MPDKAETEESTAVNGNEEKTSSNMPVLKKKRKKFGNLSLAIGNFYTGTLWYIGDFLVILGIFVLAIAFGLFIANDFSVEDGPVADYVFRRLGLERKPPGVRFAAQDESPNADVSFTVHFNGDGLSEGLATRTSSGWAGLDDLIEKTCKQIMTEIVDNGKYQDFEFNRCLPSQGARLFTHDGVRCYSLNDISQGMRTYIVPQGVHFVWPLQNVGNEIVPRSVESPIEDKPIKLRQLSMSPRVFTVENFMTQEEMNKIIEHNSPLVTPSEVGFAGWQDSTRTSHTAWDSRSWAAKRIQKRAFDVIAMPYNPDLADAVQVLRYRAPNESDSGSGEWYKPHTDWFDKKAYDGHDPMVNNGTNRFATVFLYLTDVDEGGATVFPLSTTHEGYNGEQLTHPGTERTAGYIANEDAAWVCNSSSTALRSKPLAGNAVIFYSQGPLGELDKYSLHGGCPVLKGIKWSANVWIWNREKPNKSDAKDGKPSEEAAEGINVRFRNTHDIPISIFWDDGSLEMVFQLDLEPGDQSPMKTYHGHRFVARNKETKEDVSSWRADEANKTVLIDL